jgi:hypothetical protein
VNNGMPGILRSMQVAELWRLTVGWCGIKSLRVACRSEPFDDTVRCAQSAAPPSAVEVSMPVGIGSTLAVQSQSHMQVGERFFFISHYFDSRVEDYFVSSKLVLCLTGREEWRRYPLLQTTSRVCCDL